MSIATLRALAVELSAGLASVVWLLVVAAKEWRHRDQPTLREKFAAAESIAEGQVYTP